MGVRPSPSFAAVRDIGLHPNAYNQSAAHVNNNFLIMINTLCSASYTRCVYSCRWLKSAHSKSVVLSLAKSCKKVWVIYKEFSLLAPWNFEEKSAMSKSLKSVRRKPHELLIKPVYYSTIESSAKILLCTHSNLFTSRLLSCPVPK